MAAGLQSFQSNDKQMQAIRELTNEVFNLKNRTKVLEDIGAALAIPDPEAADASKVLGVDSDGDYELQLPIARSGAGDHSIVISDVPTAGGNVGVNSILIGYNANSAVNNTTVLGAGASASNIGNTSLGFACSASHTNTLVAGKGIQSTRNNSVALGIYNDNTLNEAVFSLGDGSDNSTRSTYFYIGYDEIKNEYYIMLRGGKKLYASKIAQFADIPDAPTSDGVYKLNCTVASGEASYAWTADV